MLYCGMEPVRTVDIPTGETIGYRVREGGDVPVVLLHGNMTSSYHWDLVFEAMDDRFTLYAMDMRGFGASSYEEPIDSLHDFAADVEAFVDAVGLESFHLWGWSTGGGVAVPVAASLPGRVRSLVLMAPVSTRGYPIYVKDEAGQPTDEVAVTREEIANDPVQVVPMVAANEAEDREAYRAVWDSLIYTHNAPDEERYEAYVDDMLTQRNLVDVSYALAHFNVSEEENAYGPGDGTASDVEAPALVLHGDRDNVITRGMVEEILADLPDATFVELEDCGHSPPVDALDETVERVEEFLAEH